MIEGKTYVDNEQKSAILVAVVSPGTAQEVTAEHLGELSFLAETAGIVSAKTFQQRLEHPDVRTFVGKGKLEEMKEFVSQHHITSVIFDDDLSPSQLRNLEKEFNPTDEEERIRIYDRSLLILDIFLLRAQTAQARSQVELAMYQYLLPRLTRMWTHLERQRGGTGTRGGAGEREIETDRRIIREKIALLKEDLKKIDKQRQTQRKSRSGVVRVSLVGYTNAGKSTLMNVLSKANVKAENKLFATVDSTVRKVVLNNVPFLLSDTVGFIRKLPPHLLESFKSTLDEVRESDLLLHVVDAAHPFHDNHIEVVTRTLGDIGAGNIPVILVLNKADLLPGDGENNLEEMQRYYGTQGYARVIFVSAATRLNIDKLRKAIYDEVLKKHMQIYPNYVSNSNWFSDDAEVSTP
jgi:GTP-binding protein HflX